MIFMNTIFEPTSFNSLRKVTQILQQMPSCLSCTTLSHQFVPYQRERDHLGRLLSAKSKPFTGRTSSLKRFSPNFTSKQDPAGSTVERIFRQTRIHSQGGKMNNLKKGKIRSSSSKQLAVPAVGQYDKVQIADMLKYAKSREIVFRSEKKLNSSERTSKESTEKRLLVHYHQMSTEPVGSKEFTKGPLNLNLPELEKYLQMKKLKVPLNQNFEQSHIRFKELAQKGLDLARNIRKSLVLI